MSMKSPFHANFKFITFCKGINSWKGTDDSWNVIDDSWKVIHDSAVKLKVLYVYKSRKYAFVRIC